MFPDCAEELDRNMYFQHLVMWIFSDFANISFNIHCFNYISSKWLTETINLMLFPTGVLCVAEET